MKLFRHGDLGEEKSGVIYDNQKLDVSEFGEDYDEQFFSNDGITRLSTWLLAHSASCEIVDEETRFGSPLVRPSKLICIGLNYAKHAEESGMDIPTEPVIFSKATSSICGPNDNVVIPKNSQKTDWEVELAVVIGKKATYVKKEDVMDYVVGYMLHNDYSERAFQLEQGGQWVKGKSADTFAPLGPYLVTKDEIDDPHNLRLWLKVNGEMLQDSNTSDFVFDIPTVVSYLSQYMSLLPGDVISTGTPSGVGLGFDPPRYLKPGDVVELGIDGLGESRQKAVAWAG